MIRSVKAAVLLKRQGADREWIVLLSCGHEKVVAGMVGTRPKRGVQVKCLQCKKAKG